MIRRAVTASGVAVALVLTTLGCGDGTDGTAEPNGPRRAEAPAPAEEPSDAITAAPPGDEHPGEIDDALTISLRLDRRVDDDATEGFEAVVRATLTDERGWERAGFRFRFDDPAAPYVVVLAEGPEVDALCAPYDTDGRFSCQIGPVVALNADRWRTATPQWTGDLASYRQMLVNHEVGHLLGQHHPETPCPGPGEPAPVMAQQSTSLGACAPNPWPLEWEVACAAIVGLEPLAPGHEVDATPRCGPHGPTR